MGPGAQGIGRCSPPVVSLLTDYGLADGFVGVLHSVLHRRLPGVAVVDLGHETRPGDVRAASLALRRAAPYLSPGVVVAVVDPGVGTTRRAVAIKAKHADLVFVGPDNGLLLPALDRLGGASSAVEIRLRFTEVPGSGPTFDGRDVFAPAAALLAGGGEVDRLGPPVPVPGLQRLPVPVCRGLPGGALEAEVTWVDRYGNVQLAAAPGDLSPTGRGTGARLVVSVPGGGRHEARWVKAFADLGPGELGTLVDSDGHVALCLNGAPASARLRVGETDRLVLSPAG